MFSKIISRADEIGWRLMRSTTIITLLLLVLGACGAGRGGEPIVVHSGATMGTTFSVSIAAADTAADSASIQADIDHTLQRIEAQMSTYKSDSELSRFNAHSTTDWHPVPDDLCRAIEEALQVSRMTDGRFDITVGPLVNLWGFGPTGSRVVPPADAEVAAALTHIGYVKLETDCPNSQLRKTDTRLYVDLSGYAKGFAVDRVAEVLDRSGIKNYLVEIGGELRARGSNGSTDNWRIAIEKPLPLQRSVQRIISLSDQAMATSGDYRNFFEAGGKRYSHTIDPRSGRPVDHQLAAVSVTAQNAALADALATALLVMGPAEGRDFAARHGVAALFLVHGPTGVTEHTTMDFGITPAN
jgi:thiamine biosynthesis lipoprotein